MSELIVAVGLVLVLEGLLYAAFPDGLKSMAEHLPNIPNHTLRIMGVVVMSVGVLIVWLAKA